MKSIAWAIVISTTLVCITWVGTMFLASVLPPTPRYEVKAEGYSPDYLIDRHTGRTWSLDGNRRALEVTPR